MIFTIDGDIFPNALVLIVQLLTTLGAIGMIYGMYYLVFRLPAKRRMLNQRLDKIEQTLERLTSRDQ